MADKPTAEKFLTDPAFQADRDLFNALIDARLAHLAAEKQKREAENQPVSILDVLFGGLKKP